MKKLSDKGLDVLLRWESLSLKPYKDVGDKWTVGVGHLVTEEELESGMINLSSGSIPWESTLTRDQALEILRQDLEPREDYLNGVLPEDLTQGQYDAMVLFLFNVGQANFKSSTLFKKINAGLYGQVPEQLARWNKVKGQVVKGLTNRRNAEIALWNS